MVWLRKWSSRCKPEIRLSEYEIRRGYAFRPRRYSLLYEVGDVRKARDRQGHAIHGLYVRISLIRYDRTRKRLRICFVRLPVEWRYLYGT
jgi:hypothetical protein